MPKELFNQTLVESPSSFADDDRLALSQPSVVGGKNIKWAYFKTLINSVLSFIGLTDTPANYTGSGGKYLKVKGTEDGIEFGEITQDVTYVGTGQTYTTISAAITAGKYNLKLTSNVALTANTAVTADLTISLNGYALTSTTGDYNFTITSGKTLKIIGNGSVNFAFTTAKRLFETSNNNDLICSNVTFTNTSTVTECILGTNGTFTNCLFNAANVRYGMLGAVTGGRNWNGIIKDCQLVGGGATCRDAIWNNSTSSMDIANGLIVSGTFQPSVTIIQSLNGIFRDLTYTSATSVYLTIGKVYNLTDSGYKVNMDAYVAVKHAIVRDSTFGNVLTFRQYSKFFNCYINANANIYYNVVGTDSFLKYKLTEFNGTVTVSGNKNTFENCTFNSTVTISGSNNRFINCTFLAAVTITGDNNTFSASDVGSVTSGSLTYTITAAADKTIIDGCRTEAAISDSGTNTAIDPVTNLLF